MPKKYRLTVADLKAFRPERRLSGSYFSVATRTSSRVQAACVVSKKVSALAVERNRVKRRTRAALLPALPRLAPATYVFYAKKEAREATFAEIKNDIAKLTARCFA